MSEQLELPLMGKKQFQDPQMERCVFRDLNKGQIIVELTGHGDQINGVAIAD